MRRVLMVAALAFLVIGSLTACRSTGYYHQPHRASHVNPYGYTHHYPYAGYRNRFAPARDGWRGGNGMTGLHGQRYADGLGDHSGLGYYNGTGYNGGYHGFSYETYGPESPIGHGIARGIGNGVFYQPLTHARHAIDGLHNGMRGPAYRTDSLMRRAENDLEIAEHRINNAERKLERVEHQTAQRHEHHHGHQHRNSGEQHQAAG